MTTAKRVAQDSKWRGRRWEFVDLGYEAQPDRVVLEMSVEEAERLRDDLGVSTSSAVYTIYLGLWNLLSTNKGTDMTSAQCNPAWQDQNASAPTPTAGGVPNTTSGGPLYTKAQEAAQEAQRRQQEARQRANAYKSA